MKVSILTPTFNRGYILPKLYESLKSQTNNNFEWVIVDDGSIDDTKSIVKKWINEKKIEIRYFYQNNGGKHRALNQGLSHINNDLVFIVDSDDTIVDTAIDRILFYYDKYKDEKDICGFSFLRGFPDGSVNGDYFKSNEYKSSYIECRLNDKINGDKSEVYFTKILKLYPFLEVENERFLFEDYVWVQIANKYKMIHINEIIYIGNYLNDGLTHNIMRAKLSSPIGMSKRGLVLCSKNCNFITRIKGMMHYISYGIYSGISLIQLLSDCEYKFLFFLSFPLSIIYFYKLKRIKK